MNWQSRADCEAGVAVVANGGLKVPVTLRSRYRVTCVRNGEIVWEDGFDNLVVTAGLNKLLDAMFKTGLASPTWYVGLVANSPSPTYAAGDTTASHAGWTESVSYSNATRPTWTPGAVSGGAVDNSAAKASFTVNATDTIAGAFLADNNTKGGSTGTLYGEGSFATPRSVLSGDSLSVEIDLSAS